MRPDSWPRQGPRGEGEAPASGLGEGLGEAQEMRREAWVRLDEARWQNGNLFRTGASMRAQIREANMGWNQAEPVYLVDVGDADVFALFGQQGTMPHGVEMGSDGIGNGWFRVEPGHATCVRLMVAEGEDEAPAVWRLRVPLCSEANPPGFADGQHCLLIEAEIRDGLANTAACRIIEELAD